jgi:hypothetical protein
MTPHMPEVDQGCDFDRCVAEARRLSAGAEPVPGEDGEQRHVAIITPGRLIVPIPCPPPEAVTPQMLAGVRRIVTEPRQTIAVIAYNDLVGHGALTPAQANELIPFLGYLVGMAFDGHTVVVFEGHPSALAAGCRDADLLIVDRAMTEHLQPGWVRSARRVMRGERILLFGRDGSIVPVGAADPPSGNGSRRRWWWPFG